LSGDTRPPGGLLIGMRAGRDGWAWIAELHPATRTARVLGVLRDVSGDCAAGPSLIMCRRLDGSVGVWRIPT
jgi:hypothetical protein